MGQRAAIVNQKITVIAVTKTGTNKQTCKFNASVDLPMILTQTFLETVEENMFPQRSQYKAIMAAKITISD